MGYWNIGMMGLIGIGSISNMTYPTDKNQDKFGFLPQYSSFPSFHHPMLLKDSSLI
jgi:hypothetical protein